MDFWTMQRYEEELLQKLSYMDKIRCLQIMQAAERAELRRQCQL
jgi:hypothetical protein